uniref:Secreted protein n=1 Tax=Gouania willdenowi TaxID=441366 RepID=A0A8C5E1R8_GOUWI
LMRSVCFFLLILIMACLCSNPIGQADGFKPTDSSIFYFNFCIFYAKSPPESDYFNLDKHGLHSGHCKYPCSLANA